MNEHISEFLEYYIKLENPQFAILLNGEWGTGKTFFIQQQIEKWNSNKASQETDSDEDIIQIKPMYISLFGLNNVSQINDKIRAELHPLLYSKAANISKKVAPGVYQINHKN